MVKKYFGNRGRAGGTTHQKNVTNERHRNGPAGVGEHRGLHSGRKDGNIEAGGLKHLQWMSEGVVSYIAERKIRIRRVRQNMEE